MTSKKIRQIFIKFFQEKKHRRIPSAPLVPENDPTALFISAGMQPLVPYLLGQKHPLGTRLCSVQKCLRTDDIGQVGDRTHFTFFEMMGNWSLGDYWKEKALQWSFEFLIDKKWLNLPKNKLAVSVFAGDKDAPRDKQSAQIWQELGIDKLRIAYLGKENNWWGPAGKTGPCGPDSEIFFWQGKGEAPRKFDPKNDNWVEIWNNVFMEYYKNSKGEYEKAKQKNVDTGMGLERISAIMQKKQSPYQTDLFNPIISVIKKQSLDLSKKELRIAADHIRASVFLIGDKVEPSNLGQGYVLRRLMRRAMRYCPDLGQIAQVVIDNYQDIYPELKQEPIFAIIEKEQNKFGQVLKKGYQRLDKIKQKGVKKLSGKRAFDLYQTYGIPVEIIKQDFELNEKEFNKALEKHREKSKAKSSSFKAGLADHKKATIKLHTATHLLLAGLRKILGKQIKQAGSNITPKRLRFDFTFDRALTKEELKQVEDFVNSVIQLGLTVKCSQMPLEQAKKQGALASFTGRYPDKVKVYTIGLENNVCSKEICAGPHVKNTKELGKFKIIKEQSSSSGVRRIKAILQ